MSIRFVLVLTLALVSSHSIAQQQWLDYLRIDPEICVVENKTTLCRHRFRIHWQLKQQTKVCLYQQRQTSPLRCQSFGLNGEHSLVLDLQDDINFSLIAVDLNQQTDVTAKVLTLGAEVRRAKRRLWSVF